MARLKHKPITIEGWRLVENFELDKPQKPDGIPGDWLLKDHNGRLKLLTHEDVKQLYTAGDEEALEMLETNDWPPRG